MKYFWLKLDKNFFQQHDVRLIESMPNGKELLLFYIKLLAESVPHEGNLRFSDDVAYDNEVLAGITNTDISIVEQAMKLFEKFKLVEIKEDDTINMTQVAEMTGSVTDWAEKKRRYREQQRTQEGHAEDKEEDTARTCPIRDKSIEIRYKEKEIIKKEKNEKTEKADEVMNYFNAKMGTRYRNRDMIKARLNEGFTVEDFKTVIDKKYNKWHDDPRMCQYLRPETLFCKTHFESYLNEVDAKPKTKFGNIETHDYNFSELERILT